MLKRADLQLRGEFCYTEGLIFVGSEETNIVLGNNLENTQALRTKQRAAARALQILEGVYPSSLRRSQQA